MKFPRRWLLHRLKRALFILAMLVIILSLVYCVFFVLNDTSTASLPFRLSRGLGGDGTSGRSNSGGMPIVQYYPDNQDKLLFRKNVPGADAILPQDTLVNSAINPLEKNVGYEEAVKERVIGAKRSKTPSTVAGKVSDEQPAVSDNVHIFYYTWYANPSIDSKWAHWNHRYLPNWNKDDTRTYPAGLHDPTKGDIGANFFPRLGAYSSRDPAVVRDHMQQIRSSGAGVLAVSWYPPGLADENGLPSDDTIRPLLDAAQEYGLKLALHVEPYPDLNMENLRGHLQYVYDAYSHHPAYYKRKVGRRELPLFYLYDSYRVPPTQWQRLLSSKGDLTVRGTHLDATFVGLLVEIRHRSAIKKSKFDGFYTYFAANGFSHGSSWKNWRGLQSFARQNSLLFLPSVGPGYVDTRVRPWNGQNTRERRAGNYYGLSWRTALACRPPIVTITSFNEWHEGTQIEAAVPKEIDGSEDDGQKFAYLSYLPEEPDFYLQQTRTWIDKFNNVSMST